MLRQNKLFLRNFQWNGSVYTAQLQRAQWTFKICNSILNKILILLFYINLETTTIPFLLNYVFYVQGYRYRFLNLLQLHSLAILLKSLEILVWTHTTTLIQFISLSSIIPSRFIGSTLSQTQVSEPPIINWSVRLIN